MVRPSGDDPDFTALDCIAATFGTITAWLGRDPAVLGDDWGYRERPLSGSEWPLEDVATRRRTAEDVLAGWYGLTSRQIVHDGPREVGRYLGERLGEGTPVIVFVDAFHLPYTAQYRQQHHCHRVVLRATADDGYEVVDRYRGSLHEGTLDSRTLLAAVSAPELADGHRGDPDWRHRTIVVTPLPGPVTAPAADRFRASIARTATAYAAGAGETGLLRRSARRLREAPEGFAAPTPVGMISISAWFGELASQRALNARFLRLAATVCGMPALHEAAVTADALARQWETIRNYFFLRIRKGAPAVIRTAEMLDDIADQEKSWNSRFLELLERP
ncbi:BtrH N-terminal domain-containing protein [Streptomyces dangxiongensis]|uniref:BtrH N-terminal domain-containing protein n=1 Tax=Streptomyces dangxiongensis TaxID=1442032 RepID=UPI0013CF18AC|nr:BtrH N-terminal domain-containing protein [Streptomyces dangxiongensis]